MGGAQTGALPQNGPTRQYAVNGGLNGFQRHRCELSGRRLGVLVFSFGSVLSDPQPNPFRGRSSTFVAAVEGRMSSMTKQKPERIELLQGTLDMLILRTLLFGPSHGHQIGKHIQRTTDDLLQIQHGSLYPALHRLERKGWIVSKWETAPDRNREFKYYRLTTAGKRQLLAEESKWRQLASAVARVMWPAEENLT